MTEIHVPGYGIFREGDEMNIDGLFAELWATTTVFGHPSYAQQAEAFGRQHNLPSWSIESMTRTARRIADELRRCEPFLWDIKLWEIAVLAAREYEETGNERWHRELFHDGPTYWGFSRDVLPSDGFFTQLDVPELNQMPSHVQGFVITSSVMPDHTDRMVFLDTIYAFPGFIAAFPLPLGIIDTQVINNFQTYAILEWLRSPYVVSDRQRVTRAALRRRPPEEREIKDVNIIRLRPRRSSGSRVSDEAPDWASRWFVRGHWRQQYYPTQGGRRPKWIAPYIKGPDDKPIRTPKPTVFRVVR